MGLIESFHKMETGSEVNLSEEALGFYRIAEGIKSMLNTMNLMDFMKAMSKVWLPEGWFSRHTQNSVMKSELDGLALIKKYGVVRESDWSFKMKTQAERDKVFLTIRNKADKYINGKVLKNITLEEIITHIMIGEGAFPSAPPQYINLNGVQTSPQEYLHKELKFDTDRYVALEARSESELPQLIAALKKSLAMGYSVPLGFPINTSRIKDDTFTGREVADLKSWYEFSRDGGHLVLATDFVNQGGVEGALHKDDLLREVIRPWSELNFLVFKNSWGSGTKLGEKGETIAHSLSGYYKMDLSYLKGASHVGSLDPGMISLSIVVPIEVALDPFTIDAKLLNPKVSLGNN
jgi:hypothetical protein